MRLCLFIRLKLEPKDMERFILSVKSYPILYDTSLKDYKNGDIQGQARANIAAEFNCSKQDYVY